MTGSYRPVDSEHNNYNDAMLDGYSKVTVENNPDWFELITEEEKTEQPFQWTDELVKEFLLWYNGHREWVTGEDPIIKKAQEFKRSKPPSADVRKDKDWEILTCYTNGQNITHDYIPESDANRISNCVTEKCKIHSVKKVSTGEVFCIGDEMDNGTTIKYFLITNGYMNIHVEKDNPLTYYSVPLQMAIKKSSPPSPETKEKEGLVPMSMGEGINFPYDSTKGYQMKERIEVTNLEVLKSTPHGYSFDTSKAIPKEVFPLIKGEIQRLINGESAATVTVAKQYWQRLHEDFKLLEAKIESHQNDLLNARKESFAAGRKIYGNGKIAEVDLIFKDFDDYYNTVLQ